jgi:hypothetical protein
MQMRLRITVPALSSALRSTHASSTTWRGRFFAGLPVLGDGETRPRTLSLFPEDRCEGLLAEASIVRVKRSEVRLSRSRQWGVLASAVAVAGPAAGSVLVRTSGSEPQGDEPLAGGSTGRPGQAAGAGRELYVFAQSLDRVAKDRAIRRRQLKRLWARVKQLWTMLLTPEELLMQLGAARDQSRKAWPRGRGRGGRSQRHVQLLLYR